MRERSRKALDAHAQDHAAHVAFLAEAKAGARAMPWGPRRLLLHALIAVAAGLDRACTWIERRGRRGG